MDESNFECGCLHTFRFRNLPHAHTNALALSKIHIHMNFQNNEWMNGKKFECACSHKSGCSTHNSTPVNRHVFLVKVGKRLNIPWKWFGIFYISSITAFTLTECIHFGIKFSKKSFFSPICKRTSERTERQTRKRQLFQVIEWRPHNGNLCVQVCLRWKINSEKKTAIEYKCNAHI